MTQQGGYARTEREALKRLRDNETLILFYAKDCSPCACEPYLMLAGIECICVGCDEGLRYDRCLVCNLKWTHRIYRQTPVEVIL